ncbi:MAG TPA: hypothetical protein P5121_39730 [Caldilineaceae bacterium]|nr:hypothetical protein [Caldilineaceae bacterium]
MARNQDFDFFTTVDDEMYDDLAELTGQKIVHVELWEEALQDTLAGTETDPATQTAIDMDLYLDGGLYFELYGVLCFPDPDEEPLVGYATIEQTLNRLVKQTLWLDEIAVDEEDSLVFVLSQQHKPQLYLMIDGWSFAEWDELPDG